MKIMDIGFYWDSGFGGTYYSIFIDGVGICLDASYEKDAIKEAKSILKNKFDLDYDEKDIVFVFNGGL